MDNIQKIFEEVVKDICFYENECVMLNKLNNKWPVKISHQMGKIYNNTIIYSKINDNPITYKINLEDPIIFTFLFDVLEDENILRYNSFIGNIKVELIN